MKYKLPKGYIVKEMQRDDFSKYFKKHAPKIFSDNLDYDPDEIDSKSAQQKFKKLSKQFISPTQYRIYLGVFHKNKFIGWSWGLCTSSVVIL